MKTFQGKNGTDDIILMTVDSETKKMKWSDYRDGLIEKIETHGRLSFVAGSHLELYEKYTAKREACFAEIKKWLGAQE